MLSAMKHIRDGNLEARIKPYPTSDEFQTVNDTFNNMIDQIHELKINIYEEKINRQKSELKHLQLQINPHFFLNSLNIIHTLARAKDFELIQEMTLCLIQYFRYMFRSNLTFVMLKDELQHVRNYIRIQELRFPESLSFQLEAPEFLLNTPVPPLIIHTFVENTIKYAVTLDDPVKLAVKIELMENNCIKITISDSGKGFKEDILKELKAGHSIIDEQGEHIGIWNVQRRIQLLYKDQAKITLANGKPKGALIEIILPLEIDNSEMGV
jgi:two-component system sensor histidine kinase YesM